MAAPKDTPFIKVIVENRNPEAESQSTFVGGNNVVIKGKKNIKHYRIQLGKEVELPEPFVKQLKDRAHVIKDSKSGKLINVPLFVIETV